MYVSDFQAVTQMGYLTANPVLLPIKAYHILL